MRDNFYHDSSDDKVRYEMRRPYQELLSQQTVFDHATKSSTRRCMRIFNYIDRMNKNKNDYILEGNALKNGIIMLSSLSVMAGSYSEITHYLINNFTTKYEFYPTDRNNINSLSDRSTTPEIMSYFAIAYIIRESNHTLSEIDNIINEILSIAIYGYNKNPNKKKKYIEKVKILKNTYRRLL